MSFLDYIKWLLSVITTTVCLIAGTLIPFPPPPAVDLRGKRALVTGANVGIGKEVALWFARQGAEVFLLCRNERKAGEACEDIRRRTGNEKVFVEVIDMGSFASVKAFVERWDRRSPEDRTIDILVNNAGLTMSNKVTSEDGFEMTYEVNLLSAVLLTTGLLNRGCMSSKARIVMVSSLASNFSPPLKQEDMNSSDMLGKIEEGGALDWNTMLLLYSKTKAMQIIYTRELQEKLSRSSRFSGIVVESCHPGLVASSLHARENGMGAFKSDPSGQRTNTAVSWIGFRTAQGAYTIVFLATSPDMDKQHLKGKFWDRYTWKWTPPWMENAELRKELWKRWEQDSGLELNVA
ncbi:hypothetical protein FRB99_001724 [Tulasnella sp. 403]|nr:hypothetical protein FRB99_001724 [Tulasnella sp. 403]